MSRVDVVLRSKADRDKVCKWVQNVDAGTRVTLKEAKRTVPQNDRMWAMLTDFAQQVEQAGRKFTPDQWKVIFLHALGQEVQFLPSLDGQSFVPWGQSSSDLSKAEMTDLIELIFAEGAKRGVVFNDSEEEAA